jgi:hypothetical protein
VDDDNGDVGEYKYDDDDDDQLALDGDQDGDEGMGREEYTACR